MGFLTRRPQCWQRRTCFHVPRCSTDSGASPQGHVSRSDPCSKLVGTGLNHAMTIPQNTTGNLDEGQEVDLFGDGLSPTSRSSASTRVTNHVRPPPRSEEHTSELQSQSNLVCR